MSPFALYLLVSLDSIKNTLGGLGFISVLVAAILIWTSIYAMVNDCVEELFFATKYTKSAIVSFIFFAIIATLTPTTNQAALIYVLPKIIAADGVQEIPAKLVELANKKLEEMIAN